MEAASLQQTRLRLVPSRLYFLRSLHYLSEAARQQVGEAEVHMKTSGDLFCLGFFVVLIILLNQF